MSVGLKKPYTNYHVNINGDMKENEKNQKIAEYREAYNKI